MRAPQAPQALTEEQHAPSLEAVTLSLSGRVPKVNPFLWDSRIPLNAVSIIGGNGGEGKSTLTMWMASLVSRGELPGALYGTPRNVLLIGAEDDTDSVVVPRLIANDADLDRVFPLMLKQDGMMVPWKFPSFASYLEEAIAKDSPSLVLIDPIVSTLEGDNDKEKDVQALLHALNAIAQKYRCAIVGVKHLTKGAGKIENALGGSGQWWNAARSVHMVARDKDHDRVVLETVKQNSGPLPAESLAYRFDTVELDGVGEDADGLDRACAVEATRVIYEGISDTSVEQIRLRTPLDEDEAEERQDCAAWLKEYLTRCPGGATVVEIRKQGGQAGGYSRATLQRAANRIGVEKTRAGYQGEVTWILPQSDHAPCASESVSTLDEQTGLSPDIPPLSQSARSVLNEQYVSTLDKPRHTNDKPLSDSQSAHELTRAEKREHFEEQTDVPSLDEQLSFSMFEGGKPERNSGKGYPPELVKQVQDTYKVTDSYRKTAEQIGTLGKDKVAAIIKKFGKAS